MKMSATTMMLGASLLLCTSLLASSLVLWMRLERLESSARADSAPAAGSPAALAPAAAPVELAPYMGELQRLTHKLGLSLAANNPKLTEFYLYESRHLVQEMSGAVPEYRGHAIAILAERTLEPAYASVERALAQHANGAPLAPHFREVVAACNQCHALTSHAFIRVSEIDPEKNPYAQRFELQEAYVAQETQ